MEEVMVVGGGPAGLCAAIESARYGVKVILIDENDMPGGQLFKQIHRFFGSAQHRAGIRGYDIGNSLLSESEKLGVRVLLNTVVWGIFQDNFLGIKTEKETKILQAKKIVVGTGALENPLAFPGWTLPGVMGAGAAQTMMNIQRVLPGKRILMIGSGNVGLIVSYQLLQAGAKVVALVEALPKISGYLVHAAKISRAGVQILTSHTIVKADGKGEVKKAVIAKIDENFKMIKGTEKEIKVDLVCIAVGLRPLDELCWMAGCQFTYIPSLGGFIPLHSRDMETTVSGIYVAGDVSGIEEASTAIEEGKLAGIAIAESLGYISKKEAEEKKELSWESLRELRLGSFGEGRQKTKDLILKQYNSLHKM